MKTLPADFTARMKALLQDEYADYEKAVNSESVRGFRVNTEKISLEDFEKINNLSDEEIPYVPNGFYLSAEKIGAHPFHHAGMIYVQEPGAMAPAECVEVQPDWKILDMCASPGGKSTQLKNKLGENGVLVSNEIIASRCRILTGNVERLGLKNTVVTCCDTGKLAANFPETFDLVCVDAPCSGEGMFRKDDTAIAEWSEQNVKMCAQRQQEILNNAAVCVKGGGYILYATCTFSPEENEMTIAEFLENHPSFELVPVNPKVKECTCDGIAFKGCKVENISECRRFYPHKGRGEGQFMALLKNNAEEETQPQIKTCLKPCKDKLVFDFLDDALENYDRSHVLMYNDTPVYFTPDFPVPKGLAFSCGVTIGEIRKNYILPHHQFFMAMGRDFKRKVNFAYTDEKLKKYLSGEAIPCDCENGFAVVCCEGCSTGGGKVTKGMLKNHYPKGLRLIDK